MNKQKEKAIIASILSSEYDSHHLRYTLTQPKVGGMLWITFVKAVSSGCAVLYLKHKICPRNTKKQTWYIDIEYQ